MKLLMKIALIATAVVIIVVLAGFAAMSVIMFDLMSGTATGSGDSQPGGQRDGPRAGRL